MAAPGRTHDADWMEFGRPKWGRAVAVGIIVAVFVILVGQLLDAEDAWADSWLELLLAWLGVCSLIGLLLKTAISRVWIDRVGLHVQVGQVRTHPWDQIVRIESTREGNYPRLVVHLVGSDAEKIDDFELSRARRQDLSRVLEAGLNDPAARPVGNAPPAHPFPYAFVMLVLSILAGVLLIAPWLWSVITFSSVPETSALAQAEETASPEAEQVDVYNLEVGDCFLESQDAEEEFISSVQLVLCSEPHTDEIFAAVTLPDGDFPGTDAINAQTDGLCIPKFQRFVGRSYEESDLDFWAITPSEESWLDGDRLILCTVYDPDGEVSGSLRGVER